MACGSMLPEKDEGLLDVVEWHQWQKVMTESMASAATGRLLEGVFPSEVDYGYGQRSEQINRHIAKASSERVFSTLSCGHLVDI